MRLDLLPDEVLENILSHFSGNELLSFSKVSKRFNTLILANNQLWKTIIEREKIRKLEHVAHSRGIFNQLGPWQAYFHLQEERKHNWRQGKFVQLYHKIDTQFPCGIFVWDDILLIPIYDPASIQVFQVKQDEVILVQQMLVPVPGLERIDVKGNHTAIVMTKSNIILIFKKDGLSYIISEIYASLAGRLIRGNIRNAEDPNQFISSFYRDCGNIKVIELNKQSLWLYDDNNGRVFLIDMNCTTFVDTCFRMGKIDFKAGQEFICFWDDFKLELLRTSNGQTTYNIHFLNKVVLNKVSFNERYLCLEMGQEIVSHDLKRQTELPRLPISFNSTFFLHDDNIYIIQPKENSVDSFNVTDGKIRQKFHLPFFCTSSIFSMDVILNEFLIVFPTTFNKRGTKLMVFEIKSGINLYISNYRGKVMHCSDVLFITESENNLGIRNFT